jgi:RNA polymerase sigma-70 factor (ECF subfamily)
LRSHDENMELALPLPAAASEDEPAPEVRAARPPSDGELLQRIATRDKEAFDMLYARYVRPVYGLALRRLGDRAQAEDAVQETFTAVWRAARSYRPDRGPGAPWLYAVARNAIVDRARTRLDASAELPDAVSGEPGPAEHAESADVAWRVHRALADLPRTERDVLELAYWGGLSQSEVASFLGIPLGTVKTRTRSALSRLADALEGELR